MKACGKLVPMSNQPLPPGAVKQIAYQIMSPEQIKEVMEKSKNQGMKTFDSALFGLYEAGRISLEEALKNADSKNNLRLRIQLSEGKKPTGEEDDDSGLGGLSLQPKDDSGGH
jgi:Tfp pilus assembly ATPase PilU